MARRPYDLPTMTMLVTFEATARHGSMKSAARELNVTPGAVSRQVKALEEELGVALFTRLHRAIEPTAQGQELAETLAHGFARTAEVCHRLRGQSVEPAVAVGATTAFASLWLIPRIGGFWQKCPAITVNHAISEEPGDLRRGDIDFTLRYGFGEWPGVTSQRLFGDRLIPVCGAGLAEKIAREAGVDCAALPAEALPSLPLLRLQDVDPEWIDWDAWFRWASVAWQPGQSAGRHVNNYTVVIQAALGQQGVALGWEQLIAPMVQRGDLVRLTSLAMPAPGAHFLTWREGRELTAAMGDFRDWIMAETTHVI